MTVRVAERRAATPAQAGVLLAMAVIAGCAPPMPGTSPTGSATQAATATASPSDTIAPAESPPIAILEAGDGTYPGALGSWSYGENHSDAQWHAASGLTRIELAPGTTSLAIALPMGGRFVRWAARYAAAGDPTAAVIWPLGSAGAADDSDRFERVGFDAPPSGEWVIEVRLAYPDGTGGASYYWLVAVP